MHHGQRSLTEGVGSRADSHGSRMTYLGTSSVGENAGGSSTASIGDSKVRACCSGNPVVPCPLYFASLYIYGEEAKVKVEVLGGKFRSDNTLLVFGYCYHPPSTC